MCPHILYLVDITQINLSYTQAHQSLYIEIIFTHHQPRQCTVLLHDKHIQYNVFLVDTLSIIQCSSIIINLTSGDAAVFYPAIITSSNNISIWLVDKNQGLYIWDVCVSARDSQNLGEERDRPGVRGWPSSLMLGGKLLLWQCWVTGLWHRSMGTG